MYHWTLLCPYPKIKTVVWQLNKSKPWSLNKMGYNNDKTAHSFQFWSTLLQYFQNCKKPIQAQKGIQSPHRDVLAKEAEMYNKYLIPLIPQWQRLLVQICVWMLSGCYRPLSLVNCPHCRFHIALFTVSQLCSKELADMSASSMYTLGSFKEMLSGAPYTSKTMLAHNCLPNG